jgi:hypothetical protein
MVVLGLLPEKGDLTTLRIVRELQAEVGFSEEEHEQLQFERVGDGGWKWVEGEPKDVSVGKTAASLLKDVLRQKDEEKDLRMHEADLYERLLGDAE